jgi:predicted esterase
MGCSTRSPAVCRKAAERRLGVSFDLGESIGGPHAGGGIRTAGTPLPEARCAVVLCHGRGASADSMLALAAQFHAPETLFLAPQASGFTWYPFSFLAPLHDNEPHLGSALALLGAVVETLVARSVPAERQLLLGFSQGGCLALEFAGRNARRFGGVAGLSAGLIGPPGRQWGFTGRLDGTPVFLGCSDRDPHVPRDRVEESARELERIGGTVDCRIYPGLGHEVNPDELARVQGLIDGLRA